MATFNTSMIERYDPPDEGEDDDDAWLNDPVACSLQRPEMCAPDAAAPPDAPAGATASTHDLVMKTIAGSVTGAAGTAAPPLGANGANRGEPDAELRALWAQRRAEARSSEGVPPLRISPGGDI
jgi:hypothetical protein